MAVTIMGGLGFESILTLIGVLAIYHTRASGRKEPPVADKKNPLSAQ